MNKFFQFSFISWTKLGLMVGYFSSQYSTKRSKHFIKFSDPLRIFPGFKIIWSLNVKKWHSLPFSRILNWQYLLICIRVISRLVLHTFNLHIPQEWFENCLWLTIFYQRLLSHTLQFTESFSDLVMDVNSTSGIFFFLKLSRIFLSKNEHRKNIFFLLQA